MIIKPNYIIIPIITIAVSVIGSMITSKGMQWYKTINLPSFTPPGSFIGAVWTMIFILATISALIVWNKMPQEGNFWWIIALFLINAGLNVFWSYLFFGKHMLNVAFIEAGLLDLTVITLIILIWPVSRLAAGLLIPYAAWVAFATYLSYIIWSLNK
ncbi:MAG: TspO/MBR family protein [Candidatus Woesearchaeota archaeon]